MKRALVLGAVAAALAVPASVTANTAPPTPGQTWVVLVPPDSTSAWTSSRFIRHDRRLLVDVFVNGQQLMRIRGRMPCRARSFGDVSVWLRLDCYQHRWRILMRARSLTDTEAEVQVGWISLG